MKLPLTEEYQSYFFSYVPEEDAELNLEYSVFTSEVLAIYAVPEKRVLLVKRLPEPNDSSKVTACASSEVWK